MATKRKSKRRLVADEYRKKMYRLENAELARLAARYEKSLKAMERELVALQKRWETALVAQEDVSVDVLLKQARIHRLTEAMMRELAAWEKDAPVQFKRVKTLAVRIGNESAGALVEATNAGYAGITGTLDAAVVHEITAALSNGSPLDSLLKGLAKGSVERAKNTITDGIIRGRNPRVVARELRSQLRAPYYRAERIARTEMMRAYREATRQSYIKSGVVTGWRWDASLGGCCGACAGMHGTFHPLDEEMESHPNCRCAMTPETVSWSQLGAEGVDTSEFDPEAERDAYFDDISLEEAQRRFGQEKGQLLYDGTISVQDLPKRTENAEWGGMIREATTKEALANAAKR